MDETDSNDYQIKIRYVCIQLQPKGEKYTTGITVLSPITKSYYQLVFYNDRKNKTAKEIYELIERLKKTANGKLALTTQTLKFMSDMTMSEDMYGEDRESARYDKRISNYVNQQKIIISNRLSWDEMSLIESNIYKFSGVVVEDINLRYYRYPFSLSNIIGYVGSPSSDDLNDGIPNIDQFSIGKAGVEYKYNTQLMGTAGIVSKEVDAHGNVVREAARTPSTEGEKLQLSMDLDIQENTYKLFQKEKQLRSGSAVVMNVRTGQVISMLSYPGFDSNQLVKSTGNVWNDIVSSAYNPLINKCIGMHYPPGSTFKPVVLLAALEAGYNVEKKFICSGNYTIPGRRFHCWKKQGHGVVNGASDAIAQSCGPYFYNLGREIGINNITNMAKKMGFGQKTGIELPNEISGLVSSPMWKMNNLYENWIEADTLNAATGQGYSLSTPLQIATMSARIASGLAVTPTILMNERAPFEQLGISENSLNYVRMSMDKVVNDPKGVVYWYKVICPKYRISGKTGTAQVVSRRLDLTRDDNDYESLPHALFTGFAPADNPEYAFAVVIEHGKGGAGNAAPIALRIMRDILHNRIKRSQKFS